MFIEFEPWRTKVNVLSLDVKGFSRYNLIKRKLLEFYMTVLGIGPQAHMG